MPATPASGHATAERHLAVAGERLAPFVPSPQPMVDKMLALAQVQPADTVYDLGAGNGQIVIAAAQRFGARATGIEIDGDLVRLATARVAESGLGSRARILHGDILSTDLSPATVIALYQLPAVNERLRPLFEAQLRPGARVVSLDFPIPGWTAARVVTATLPDSSQHAIYLYSIGQKREVAMALQQAYTAGRFALELDGASAGLVRSAEGGAVSADVVAEKLGPDGITHKHLAGVKYEDITIDCGTGMSKAFYAWIADTLNRTYTHKDGAVVGFDQTLREMSRLDFHHALISEIGFPALDASSKEAAAPLTVKIAPEYTSRQIGSRLQLDSSEVKAQRRWLRANFRLEIGGLDCTAISKIDALTVRQVFVEDAVGDSRDYEQVGYLDVPNLAVELPESRAKTFYDWMDDFVIKGYSGANAEKTGTLRYLAPNLRDAYFTLTLHNLGIFRLAPLKIESGKETARRVRAEMYCEAISFSYDETVVWSGVAATPATITTSPPSQASALAWKVAGARPSPASINLPDSLVRAAGLKFRS
jgi:SAM-dependent methyltransferase